MTSDFIEVRTATASEEVAQKIAKALVEQRLTPSAQVTGPITSFYWWQEKMVTASEWVVTAKTRGDLYKEIEKTIRQLHPYQLPGIVAFPIVAGYADYIDWIRQETKKETQ